MTETAHEKFRSEILRSSRFEGLRSKIAIPLISILLAVIAGTIILLLMAEDPITSFYYMTFGTMKPVKIADTLFNATPLLFTGLSVAVAFRGGMFNIGTEGQMIFGAFCAALVGFGLPMYFNINLPPYVLIPLLLLVGMVGGAIWALVPAILKAKTGVHEVITTIMMNYVALTLMVFFVGDLSSPFIDRKYHGNVSPQSPKIAETGVLDKISTTFIGTVVEFLFAPFRTSKLHWGFVIGIIACFVIFILLWKTQLGYETRAVGFNQSASKYGGINVSNNLIKVMLISGALGGLAGAIEVMAVWGRYVNGFSSGYGFDGIAVALIGGNHPIGVIFGSILFGWLKSGGQVLQISGTSKDLANALKGLIVFFVAVPLIAKSVLDHFSDSKEYETYQEARNQFKTHEGFESISMIEKIRVQSIQYTNFVVGIFSTEIIRIVNSIRDNIRIITAMLIMAFGALLAGLIASTLAPSIQEIGDNLFSPISAQITKIEFLIPINDFLTNIFSIETLFSILLFLTSAYGYFWVNRFENSKYYRRMFLFFLGIFGISSFLGINTIIGQELTLLVFTLIIMGFIVYQEYLAIQTKPVEQRSLDNLQYTPQQKIAIRIYSLFSGIVVLLIIALIYLSPGIIPIPFDFGEEIKIGETFDFFFFSLNNYGALLGIVGLVFLIICFIVMLRIQLPRNHRLSYIFNILALIFFFFAVSGVYNLNATLLFTMTLSIAAPIGLASLGGMFSEKSGVVNIGLEGMMLTGAFVSVWLTYETGDPWAGIIGSIVAGGLIGLLHAVASIKYRADQVVVGVAINLLASALTTLGLIAVWNVRGTSPTVTSLTNIRIPVLEAIPIIGDLLYALSGGKNGLSPVVYIFLLAIIISWWVIQKTSFGLRVRAVGEHPRAADTLGINVFLIRYICVMLSGVLAALGGAQLTLGTVPIFVKNMTSGRGFVALAALIFGAWNPIGAALASLLFGFAYAFRFQLDSLGISWLFQVNWLPAIMAVLVLITFILLGLILLRWIIRFLKIDILGKESLERITLLPALVIVFITMLNLSYVVNEWILTVFLDDFLPEKYSILFPPLEVNVIGIIVTWVVIQLLRSDPQQLSSRIRIVVGLSISLTIIGIIFIIAQTDLFLEKLTPTLPFLITMIAVATVAKRGKPPAADGIPYIKEG
ncbi:hypothetical protein CEE45_03945 [Candidatus Heimdallarchaeota archaeon B3_Heim]|nr:MAG: hypothetical protein CEE45_03945 [Candidatus Heimdallarchaeota archaeon B3_Heim]